MILRGLAIWSGVGLGHLAVLGALWSGSPAAPEGRPLLLDLRFVAALPSAAPSRARVAPGEGQAADQPRPAPPPSRVDSPPADSLASLPVARPPSPASPGVTAALASPAPAPRPAPPASLTAQPPRFLERIEPAYPSRARLAGIEGSVTVRLRLSEHGRVVEADISRGSGSRLLDDAALFAARASRYEPARLGEQAVPSETEATYRFELR